VCQPDRLSMDRLQCMRRQKCQISWLTWSENSKMTHFWGQSSHSC
jgi:hypothetical protein